MNRLNRLSIGLFLYVLLFLVFSSCGMLGIRFKVHNPKSPGVYPNFTQEQIALGGDNKLRSCYDVTHYNLDIAFDTKHKKLSGWVNISATMLEASNSIQIDLVPSLIIDSCQDSQTGKPLSFTRNGRAVIVVFSNEIRVNQNFGIAIKYGGSIKEAKKAPWEGGLVWKTDKQDNLWAGIACESEGASIWFPCKDMTNDEPDSADMHFSIPESNLMVVSNGTFKGKTTNNKMNTFHWKVRNPINLYNITFYIGNYVKVEDTFWGAQNKQLKIEHYVLKPNQERAQKHFSSAKEHIRVYESLYGSYAWYNDGFKLVESPYEGMEHQTAIAYGNGFKNDLMGVEDYIMLHEIGHEWFGNAVTAADLADVWIQEGITTYGEALYLEQKYGKDYADSHLRFYKLTIKNKRPLVGPFERRFFDYKDGDVYVKGAWMLHSLRTTIDNDSLFFAGLKTFYGRYAKKTTSSKDFIEVFNQVTGTDYNWFFKQYLYNSKAPFLEYKLEKGTIYYRWKYVADDFKGMPVTLNIKNDKPITIYPTTTLQRKKIGNGNVKFNFAKEKALYGTVKNNRLQ